MVIWIENIPDTWITGYNVSGFATSRLATLYDVMKWQFTHSTCNYIKKYWSGSFDVARDQRRIERKSTILKPSLLELDGCVYMYSSQRMGNPPSHTWSVLVYSSSPVPVVLDARTYIHWKFPLHCSQFQIAELNSSIVPQSPASKQILISTSTCY